jgi:hypothetical protein
MMLRVATDYNQNRVADTVVKIYPLSTRPSMTQVACRDARARDFLLVGAPGFRCGAIRHAHGGEQTSERRYATRQVLTRAMRPPIQEHERSLETPALVSYGANRPCLLISFATASATSFTKLSRFAGLVVRLVPAHRSLSWISE